MITQPTFDYPAILRHYRNLLEMSQQQVSDVIGINRSTYQSYEEGRAEPSLELIFSLMQLYGVDTVNEFLMMKEVKTRKRSWLHISYYRLPLDKRAIVDFILNQNQ